MQVCQCTAKAFTLKRQRLSHDDVGTSKKQAKEKYVDYIQCVSAHALHDCVVVLSCNGLYSYQSDFPLVHCIRYSSIP